MSMDYEQAFEDAGGYGRFQIVIMLFMGSSAFRASYNLQGLVFQPYEMKFRCQSVDNDTSVINKTFNGYCYENRTGIETRCTTFEYDSSVMHNTLVSKYDLVCDRRRFISLLQSLSLVGTMIGTLAGTAADQLGRRKMVFIFAIIEMLTGWLPLVMPNIETQLFSRVVTNLSSNFNLINFVILTEIVTGRMRPMNVCFYWFFWSAGYAACSGVAKLLPDWKWIQIMSFVPMLFYPFIMLLAPESPRWLALKKRHDEALNVYEKIARFNGVKFDSEKYRDAILKETEEESANELWNVFKSRIMTTKFIILIFAYWVLALVYYGLSLDAHFATDDIFLNGLFNGLIEIPSYLLSWKMLDWWGRKRPIVTCLILSGAAVVVTPFLPSSGHLWPLKLTVAMIGKLLLNTSFSSMGTYSAELLPTSVRSSFFFIAICVGGIASISAPFVLSLLVNTNLYFLVGIILGAHSLVCGLLLIMLPDTTNCPLSQTVAEADNLQIRYEHQVRISPSTN